MCNKLTVKDIKILLDNLTSDIPQHIIADERKQVQVFVKQTLKRFEKEKLRQQKLQDMLSFEYDLRTQGKHYIAGIDEVGRGCLAGPVVAACVIMPMDDFILGVNDSKQLSQSNREELFDLIREKALGIGIGMISAEKIDEVNIYEATKLAMIESIVNLCDLVPSIQVDHLLIDAMQLDVPYGQTKIIKGDARSYSIACASIIAKVTRDRLMQRYSEQYPVYHFDKNVGYGTKDHLQALSIHGITAIHRKTFEPIKSMINNG